MTTTPVTGGRGRGRLRMCLLIFGEQAVRFTVLFVIVQFLHDHYVRSLAWTVAFALVIGGLVAWLRGLPAEV